MREASYYTTDRIYMGALLRDPIDGTFYLYFPDFDKLIKLLDENGVIAGRDEMQNFIDTVLPGQYPRESGLVSTIFKTKKYLRIKGWSIDTYIDNYKFVFACRG